MGKPNRRFRLTNLDTSATKLVSIADSFNITERHFRSMDYNSVLRIDTIPLKFPRDGGRAFDYGGYYFILDAKEQYGVKARIQLDIERLNPDTDGYEASFTGVLEFSPNGGYTKEDEYISVKVVDSRKLAKFKERDEIEYDVFSLVSSDNITVPDFPNPYTEAEYKKIDTYLKCDTDGATNYLQSRNDGATGNAFSRYSYEGVLRRNEIGDGVLITGSSASYKIYENTAELNSTTFIISSLSFDITSGVVFTFIGSINQWYEVFIEYYVRSYNSSDALQETVVSNKVYNFSEFTDNLTETVNISVSGEATFADSELTVPPGGYIEYELKISANSIVAAADVTFSPSPRYEVTEFIFHEKTDGQTDSNVKGMYSIEAIQRLIQLTTSETDTAKLLSSSILGRTNSEFQSYPSDGDLSREFITNGFQLRGFNDKALNISFKDLFISLSNISPLGLWYDKSNDIFVIEDIEDFYKTELFPFNLGQVKDIKTTDFKELYFNSIPSGYPQTEYEEYQGVNETNTKTEHEISIEVKSKFDARSIYNGDSQGQEFARRANVFTYASQDTKYDNLVYLTTLNTSDETIQGDLSNLSGFIGVDELYNLRKTPRQNLQRQSPLLLAPIYKDDSEIISFRNSVKDTNIFYTDPETNQSTLEFSNIEQNLLRERLVDPELDEFEGLFTEAIANEITSDPHRIMPYIDREGNNKYGYIWDVEGNRKTGKAQYRLIKCNPNRVP